MNLFTKHLSQRKRNKQLAQLIAHWDQLELLIITVFKSQQATAEDERIYAETRQWLLQNYQNWETELGAFWPATLVGGAPAPEDPFRRLFQHQQAADFVGDWVAMQNLAAAREALNRLVIAS